MERARWIYWVAGGIVALFALPALALPLLFIGLTMLPLAFVVPLLIGGARA